MVILIDKIAKLKDYKEDTFYLAVSLADRYLVHIAVLGRSMPSLTVLAVSAILMAAKLEQPISPSFSRMVRLVDEQFELKVDKQSLIDMEERIIRILDFSLLTASPITFMERYMRIFGVDQVGKDEDADMVSALARKVISIMIKDRSILNYKPSQIGAAALLLSLNILDTQIAKAINLKKIVGLNKKSHYNQAEESAESDSEVTPFDRWNKQIISLTSKKIKGDIQPAYLTAFKVAN